ncbi:MAG: ribonuclease PH [Rickettsiales bacterium]|nr:ribonuclease PH [Rickettsiales bacterium]
MNFILNRASGRKFDELREVKIEKNTSEYAEGSCIISFGKTKLICTASIDEKTPPFLRNTGKGWVTAEYGMLPRSTHSRMEREAAKGKQSGRTIEIQRLIGRSLRAVMDLSKLGERQIIIDCDVINADGGTRTAAITGGFIALQQAVQKLLNKRVLKENPILDSVSAISCGIYNNVAILDLEYSEDVDAQVDANFIITGSGKMVEIQCTGEEASFTEDEFNQLLTLAKKGCAELKILQN